MNVASCYYMKPRRHFAMLAWLIILNCGEKACNLVFTGASVVPQVLGSSPCGSEFSKI